MKEKVYGAVAIFCLLMGIFSLNCIASSWQQASDAEKMLAAIMVFTGIIFGGLFVHEYFDKTGNPPTL